MNDPNQAEAACVWSELASELGALADRFECHALSRSLDDMEAAGRVMRTARDEIEMLRAALKLARDWLPYHEPDHPGYEGERSDAGRAVRLALDPRCGCSPPNVEALRRRPWKLKRTK